MYLELAHSFHEHCVYTQVNPSYSCVAMYFNELLIMLLPIIATLMSRVRACAVNKDLYQPGSSLKFRVLHPHKCQALAHIGNFREMFEIFISDSLRWNSIIAGQRCFHFQGF